MKAEEYFKEWGKVCRFVKWKLEDQVHTHRTMLEFAEAYANEERERILGIIEELAEKSGLRIGEDGKFKPWHLLQKEELIEKIKG